MRLATELVGRHDRAACQAKSLKDREIFDLLGFD